MCVLLSVRVCVYVLHGTRAVLYVMLRACLKFRSCCWGATVLSSPCSPSHVFMFVCVYVCVSGGVAVYVCKRASECACVCDIVYACTSVCE